MWLKNGRNSVLVTPQGGSVLQWQVDEHFVLGPARSVRVSKDQVARRGESHWCCPNFGTPPSEWASFGKHGFVRHRLFDSDYYGTSLRNARFYDRYSRVGGGPGYMDGGRAYVARAVVSVEIAQLRVTLSVKNQGEKPVPILPAFHPYFAVPKAGARVVGGIRTLASITGTDVVGVCSKARVLEYAGPITIYLNGIGSVEMDASSEITHIVLWSDRPDLYLCVEPVFGQPGSFGKPEGRWLKQGEGANCEVVLKFKKTE